ncbi:AMP-binding protein [Aquihabitans sp. G128]|uniref:AMP-binding protein n=1 Tax=Aquihabitans sp. G128 TaxID=2849779 RepID=UPI001C24B1CE|nr:AMP-binding protein [Aquihabitans sp. G128]QXC61023.1 AMP-binding protein [Aquihabitans sp. G128]
MSEPIWEPDPATVADTNVGRFQARHGIATFPELVERSIEDPAWFWGAATEFLGIPFSTPYEQVLDTSKGIPWATWFTGGQTNLAAACVDRWAADSPDAEAIRWEGEDGEVRLLTYAELDRHVDGLAALLRERGIGQGDAVGIFLPMLVETVVAAMAVAKLGAIFLPVFSGYGAEAIAVRLEDAGAKALLCADGFYRRAKVVPTLATALDAVGRVPSVETVVVVPRVGPVEPAEHGAASVLPWPAATPVGEPPRVATVAVDSEHPLFIAYTSGTTGKPKGAVHVHGGFTVKIAEEVAFQFDCRPGDRLFWFADFGWIMGPWEVVGALANGATLCLFEGAPDFPDTDRLWAYLAAHRVTILGISPTLVRSMMAHGDEPVRRHDLSALRILGSTGEPWNEDPYRWFAEVVGGGRCPIINISGGTEVGACFLSCHPVQALTPMTLGGPALGMAVDVFDDHGQPVRGQVGELVCTKPWPGMTRGLWQAPERYLETYWDRWPDVWVHGDWALIEDGQWYLRGRSDDTIKIAGKRLGPAEVESALVAHAAVSEAAAVGIPHEVKGEALWCFVVLAPGAAESEDLRAELVATVTEALGKSFKPSAVRFVDALPKTRSAKVVRRAIRATTIGADPGDLSSLEDPATVDALRNAR